MTAPQIAPRCQDEFTTGAKGEEPTTYLCTKTAGHIGPHSHPSYPGGWATKGSWPRVEIVVGPDQLARTVRINGWEVPSLHEVSVEYAVNRPRTVYLEIYASEVVEVPE